MQDPGTPGQDCWDQSEHNSALTCSKQEAYFSRVCSTACKQQLHQHSAAKGNRGRWCRCKHRHTGGNTTYWQGTLFAQLISQTLDQILTLKFQPLCTILTLLHAALPCPGHPCRQDGTRQCCRDWGGGSFLHSHCRAAPCVTGAELQRAARGERRGRATSSSHSAHSTEPALPKTTTGESRMTPGSPPS